MVAGKAKLTFGLIALAFLHNVTARGDSIEEKRLRARYCFGSVNYMMPLAERLCEGLPDILKRECDQEKEQAKLRNEVQRRRLLTYLMATETSDNSGDMLAAAQGKSDAAQCFMQMNNPQFLSCSLACFRSLMSHSSRDDFMRAKDAALDICRDQCEPVCKQPVRCGTYNPW